MNEIRIEPDNEAYEVKGKISDYPGVKKFRNIAYFSSFFVVAIITYIVLIYIVFPLTSHGYGYELWIRLAVVAIGLVMALLIPIPIIRLHNKKHGVLLERALKKTTKEKARIILTGILIAVSPILVAIILGIVIGASMMLTPHGNTSGGAEILLLPVMGIFVTPFIGLTYIIAKLSKRKSMEDEPRDNINESVENGEKL